MPEPLEKIGQIISSLGFSLDQHQPHISGERFLMMKNKLVLMGQRLVDGKKVAIKISDHPDGQKEIAVEKKNRDILESLAFASDSILFPEEIYYGRQQDYLIWVTEFITQEKVFVAQSIEEQFFTALRTLQSQEAFHASTFEHLRQIKTTFSILNASDYLKNFQRFKTEIETNYPDAELEKTLTQAQRLLERHRSIIDRYGNYLTHTDFVPHNFRLKDHRIYLLDCSSILFGNKYEGWARLINYLVIHNPELGSLLANYVADNRGEDEALSLRLMQIYKLGFLLEYYVRSLPKTSGNLKKLTQLRINFWYQVLKSVLDQASLPAEVLANYLQSRDNLRSEEEKDRQREFAIA